jgi:hypothetical protein
MTTSAEVVANCEEVVNFCYELLVLVVVDADELGSSLNAPSLFGEVAPPGH